MTVPDSSKARRLSVHTVESAPEGSRAQLEAVQKRNGGYLPNLLGVLSNSPTVLESYLTLSKLNGKTSLTPDEREVVQLMAATTHGCSFCVAGHTLTAQKTTKLSAEDIEALRGHKTLQDSKLAALASYTSAVIANRGAVSDEELQAFFDAGYDQAQALEVVLGVGLATICNFGNNVAQTTLNPELEPYRWDGLS
ncbi:Carboxymuconolactone decarboxylase (plasmid) [Deinococcus proteolyticus MRP]|uniref:Carboxymuconolactone decarboxylase n=1 Tax=Deinococcus proteolyticus (strain ATCC 35074 / DSM 20540 / JCM 6276 / NBRC 101906 / NCIMB 13154 / VKM Ac-1939 / CCM 2703 / MRP) TaxID=693977 RepID=F0RRC6_DEIPM|nr:MULTISPECIES: carboxymuconolactone decarboxylase family protein [Deinococcus]ADY27835.1 Carboxymuconolactone decarboxylase [Deinococcus proteolyticus MRP]MCY1703955.1 carboxymuconolactone decarboxylase family protein [Deinococcus sp. SL84]